ncbi:MAG: hypothetical protein P4M14_10625 [Gammaproteobacteria bacterium]|nr:hypothetical protein [Gammaproteobacteria bacterium]
MAGRFSSFASTMVLGFALGFGFSASALLTLCGLLGLLSAALLGVYQSNKVHSVARLDNG